MKNKITILMVALMIILTSVLILPVDAANAAVNLNSETQAKAGDTFIVTLNASYEEGINGIEATLSYDKDKLELTDNFQIVNTLNWSVLNETVEGGLNLAIVSNSSSKITNADIIKMEFKVKDTASVGTTAKISLKDITIDGDTANSTQQLGTKEIEISIIEEATNPGDKPTDDPEDKPTDDPADKPTNDPVDKPTDDPADKPTNDPADKPTDDPADKPTNDPADKPTGDSTDKSDLKDIKEDNTKTEEKMPDTGISSVVGIMIIVAIFGTICLVKYNKYREI